MREGFTAEVAHKLTHIRGQTQLQDEFLEILEALLLAVVAIATAWSGYQSARWEGKQAHLYSVSEEYRLVATQAATLSGQQRLYDTSTFSFWLQARSTGDAKTALMFEKRFRPEYRPAFTAWLATHPFTNPDAPAGPLVMPQYRNAQSERAARFERRASAAFEVGTAARENGDRYVRDTVLLATILFLTAMAQRFRIRAVRIGMLGVCVCLLAVATYFVASYPVA